MMWMLFLLMLLFLMMILILMIDGWLLCKPVAALKTANIKPVTGFRMFQRLMQNDTENERKVGRFKSMMRSIADDGPFKNLKVELV